MRPGGELGDLKSPAGEDDVLTVNALVCYCCCYSPPPPPIIAGVFVLIEEEDCCPDYLLLKSK